MSKWILLVEDNENDADLALRAMSDMHEAVKIVVACDGVAALDCLHRRGAFGERDAGNPAVVVLDLKMPRLDGFEALQQIKNDPALKQIPVVVFTSSGEEIDVARSYQLGANAYVVKPVDFKQYISAVRDLQRYWVSVNEPPPVQTNTETPGAAQMATAM